MKQPPPPPPPPIVLARTGKTREDREEAGAIQETWEQHGSKRHNTG